MTTRQLKNYLRTHRKRLGLSQDDLAFLLGVQSGTKICRYERYARVPSLETALAYEAIFQKPVSELFGGLYQDVKEVVSGRAKALTYRKDLRTPGSNVAQKLEALKAITSS